MIDKCKNTVVLFGKFCKIVYFLLAKEEYQKKIEGDDPIRGRERINKDMGLVNKLNILANAMDKIPDEDKVEKI